MKMQICKLYFGIILIILFSANVIAEDFIVNTGEGDVNVVLDRDYVVEDGKIVPLEDPKIDNSSETEQNNLEINSEEQSSQEKLTPLTGAVVGSKPKNYILPILIIFTVIVGIFIVSRILKKK